MTKEVLLTISGLQQVFSAEQEDALNEPVKLITPATYYQKNGKHYVRYEEPVEGESEGIHSTIRLSGDGKVEVMRSGLSTSHMIFEKDTMHRCGYKTPYGEMTLGIFTSDMKVNVKESDINVSIAYALEINEEKAYDCNIEMNIKAKEKDRLPD